MMNNAPNIGFTTDNVNNNQPNLYGYEQPSAPPLPQVNQAINAGYNQPPPSYAQSSQFQQAPISREERFKQLILNYEINKEYADKLQKLQGFKIVFLFDDSSSMRSTLSDSPLNQTGNHLKATRWDELKYFANISLDIATFFNPTGVDVYFLNRPSVKNVVNSSLLIPYLNDSQPNGYTPLTHTLNSILQDNRASIRESRLLVIIVTDGEPTDHQGTVNIKEFKKCLRNRSPIDRIFINIVACTDEEDSMSYLNKWDREIPNLDVVDDYRNERQQIKSKKGSNYRFSYGDYVVKTMIGSIDRKLDETDEHTSGCLIA